MKKTVKARLILILRFISKKTESNCKLVVMGVDVSSECSAYIDYENKNAELPLFAIVKALGGTVDWKSSKSVVITINGVDYKLDTENNSLVKSGDKFNIIGIPPGATHAGHYRLENNEFYIDDESILHFISILDKRINIDYETAEIEITDK